MNNKKKPKYELVWIKWEREPLSPWPHNNESHESHESHEEQEGELYQEEEETPQSMFAAFPMMTPIMPAKVITEKDFEFWMGHTNFRITKDILDIIVVCPGIEAVDILTPYRFRIAVGVLFKVNEVLASTAQTLIGYLQNDKEEVRPSLY